MGDDAQDAVGTVLPGVVDRHVHLGLVDRRLLAGSCVVEVHDLGWDPATVGQWAAAATREVGPAIRFAGPFHTAPGGYPSGRAWAPSAAVRHVASAQEAVDAVAAVAAAGGSFVKIALHAGMSLLPDAVLDALVRAAHHAALPAYVHAEGPGQAERAIAAGADTLVHVPWTEVVPDRVVAAAAARTTWVSTLSIHGAGSTDLDRALDNARRFVAAGGRLVYGTDMGNGPTPVGVNGREIHLLGEAGLAGELLRRAVLAQPLPTTAGSAAAGALTAPLPVPQTAADLVRWLAIARRVPGPRPRRDDEPAPTGP